MKLFQTYATDTNFTNLIPLGGDANKTAIAQLTTRILGSSLGSQTGFPHIISLDTNRTSTGAYISRYITSHDYNASLDQNIPIDISSDSRSNYDYAYLTARRFDGASAALRGSVVAGMYAAASATPGGAYKLFNLNGNKYFGAGWGNHGNPASILNDFTMRSHVATRWARGTGTAIEGTTTTVYKGGSWKPTINPLELVTAFDGDRVSVIDFSKTRKLKSAYTWNPITEGLSFENEIADAVGAAISQTQDFIKFYLTGPTLHAGNTTNTDDIMVFRAIINSLSDSFQPNWTPQPMIGRADPNYQYTGFARDLNLDFTVYATSRDEVKPIWRKLNALAGYTAPIYDDTTIGLKGAWMRLTLGDLFIQQPVILTSLTYTFDNESPWEINIEQDPTMMQVPIKIGVQCNFNVISDYLPQKGGRFYTLAKKFKSDSGDPIKGNDNWLSDFETNADIEITKREKKKKEDTLGDKPKDPRATRQQNSEGKLENIDAYEDNSDPFNPVIVPKSFP